MSQELVTSATDIELIATAMLAEHGDLAKASRHDTVQYNAMALRKLVASEPAIRDRYQVLLAEELESSGLHIAERILVIKKLQDQALKNQIRESDPNLLQPEFIDSVDKNDDLDLLKPFEDFTDSYYDQEMISGGPYSYKSPFPPQPIK